MALSVNRITKVITVPQADLTFVTGTLYELDTDVFRLNMKSIEASEEGIIDPDMHQRNEPVTVAGTTFAQTLEIINGFSVEFEDGSYSVRLVGSNNNIFDVENGILVQNLVQVISNNSGGLIASAALNTAEALQLTEIHAELRSIEDGKHHSWLMRVILAAIAGKSNSFPGGPVKFRDKADTKDRITATVDSAGNRTVITLDGD